MSALDTQEGGSHHKGGAEDIRKAMHYCRLILELTYGEAKE